MTCELFSRCNFFKIALADMPQSAEYIQNKLCMSDYDSCSRYHKFKDNKRQGKSSTDLFTEDSENLRLTIPDKIKSDDNCRDLLNLLATGHIIE